jgi:uncharacterized protein YuzE
MSELFILTSDGHRIDVSVDASQEVMYLGLYKNRKIARTVAWCEGQIHLDLDRHGDIVGVEALNQRCCRALLDLVTGTKYTFFEFKQDLSVSLNLMVSWSSRLQETLPGSMIEAGTRDQFKRCALAWLRRVPNACLHREIASVDRVVLWIVAGRLAERLKLEEGHCPSCQHQRKARMTGSCPILISNFL